MRVLTLEEMLLVGGGTVYPAAKGKEGKEGKGKGKGKGKGGKVYVAPKPMPMPKPAPKYY